MLYFNIEIELKKFKVLLNYFYVLQVRKWKPKILSVIVDAKREFYVLSMSMILIWVGILVFVRSLLEFGAYEITYLIL